MPAETQTLELPGLREDILRDHLAALGLLDWLTALFADHQPRLAWSIDTGCPNLHFSQKLPDDWSAKLLEAIQSWEASTPHPLSHGKIEGIPPSTIREILSVSSDFRLIRFYCGITSQLSVEGSGRRSELIIESASRSVLKGVQDLLTNARNPIDFESDLLGLREKREVSNTSRWHPAEYQPAAYCATDPQYNKHQDWVGLNVLALFGTSFYPLVDTQKGRSTAGFRRLNRTSEFSWPVWKEPLIIDEVRSLLTHPACHQEPIDPSILSALGIERIWRSRRFKPDGNNDYFSTAMLA